MVECAALGVWALNAGDCLVQGLPAHFPVAKAPTRRRARFGDPLLALIRRPKGSQQGGVELGRPAGPDGNSVAQEQLTVPGDLPAPLAV